MKKKEKIVKILSDGTVAKVGMIVVIQRSTIVQIKATVKENAENRYRTVQNLKELPDYILCSDGMFSPLKWIRKATPEERKQYYKDLYARINE